MALGLGLGLTMGKGKGLGVVREMAWDLRLGCLHLQGSAADLSTLSSLLLLPLPLIMASHSTISFSARKVKIANYIKANKETT